MPWYVYNSAASDVSNPNNYGSPQIPAPSCPGDNNFLCAIQATDNMGDPDLTDVNLIIEIANAVNNRTETTNVKLRPTK